ncbi:growth arrest and DNA damage-inducible protein GADD45 beta-like [Xiphophorus maculatus]|uniref:Growth arrest and DNA damage-inducible protein GADD45 beta-like n=1 Tax=Xiphophorus maculatus TaxID=8083 RepID=A0A3B5QS00_XIPMA|nr:growth arrest and DNA damage-inducible protein GADD45 beta-like [Xiphophorus maculatus]XP_027856104.1 growth arrest and DNA damage-inducible protein GADD45 beta-like [Xiphophorus couchianus]XP_032402774.1 growth arrest and DNA damage-inducible protein GADD45 beta-like [Xiphophorus hellerii]
MIPEESFASAENRMQSASLALEELLVTAQKQHCLTVGIYESAKLLNADPDSVVLCVLAADDEEDVALQIHFTLLQSFCCDSGINILRVSGVQRLWQLLGGVDANRNQEESGDLHCMLVTNLQVDHCRLQEVGTYCQESRLLDQWVPELVLQER